MRQLFIFKKNHENIYFQLLAIDEEEAYNILACEIIQHDEYHLINH